MTVARKLAAVEPLPVEDDEALDPREQAEIAEAWRVEIERRITEHDAGHGKTYSLEEVDAEVRTKFGWE